MNEPNKESCPTLGSKPTRTHGHKDASIGANHNIDCILTSSHLQLEAINSPYTHANQILIKHDFSTLISESLAFVPTLTQPGDKNLNPKLEEFRPNSRHDKEAEPTFLSPHYPISSHSNASEPKPSIDHLLSFFYDALKPSLGLDLPP